MLKNPGVQYVREDLLRKIDRRKAEIENHPEYSNQLRKARMIALAEEANRHSYLIEINGEDSKLAARRESEIRVEVGRNLSDAWGYGLENYPEQLDHDFIYNLISRIEPHVFSTRTIEYDGQKTYRKFPVRVTGTDSVATTKPEKVLREMTCLLDVLNEDHRHPVERAVTGHIHTARIHPFGDGNGRLARLIQNLILRHNGFCPVLLERGERELYMQLLRGAMREYTGCEDWNVERPQGQLFGEYIASKELATLDRLRDTLSEMRKYRVVITKPGKGNVQMGLRNTLNNFFRRFSPNGHHRIQPIGKNELIVTGDISADQLDTLVAGYGSKAIRDYRIDVLAD